MVTNEENKEVKKEESQTSSQTSPASSPEQQQAKSQIETKAEHLDNVVKSGEQIEKETSGENPDWKGVKDLHAGKAPIDKVLYDKTPEEKKVETTTPKVETNIETKPEAPKQETVIDTGPKFRSSKVNEWIKSSKSSYNK